jgi:hypothetical protein
MAKLARENRLRERRIDKAARKEARRNPIADQPDAIEVDPETGIAIAPEAAPAGDAVAEPGHAEDASADADDKDAALRRLRDAPDEELAIFEGTLREGALQAGATEGEIRSAQRDHPGHGA